MNVKFILGIYFIGVVLRFEIKIYRCYCIYVMMSEMNGGVLVRFKKILSAITSLALSATVFTGVNLNVKADAAQSNWKFDFGAGGVARDIRVYLHQTAIIPAEAMASIRHGIWQM